MFLFKTFSNPLTTRRVRHGRSMGFCPSLCRPLEIPILDTSETKASPAQALNVQLNLVATRSINRAIDTKKKHLGYIKIFQKPEKALHLHHLPIAPFPKETKQLGRFSPRPFSWLRLFLLRLGLVRIFPHTGQKHPQKKKKGPTGPRRRK